MARKRKELPLLQGVEIIDVAAEGNSLAKVDEMVVFIPFGAPGDIADVKIDKKKKSYAEGHIENMIRSSDVRVEPRCEYFTVCGGCRWQHLPYEFQLKCKHQQVQDALQRIAKIPFPEINPIIGSENVWEYRNKMEYTFSNKMWLTFDQLKSGQDFPDRRAAGFHIPGAFDKVLDINKCHLQDDLGNRIRLFIKNFGKEHGYSFYDLREQHGFLRTLMIRIASTGEVMVIMVVGDNDPDKIEELMAHLSNEFPEITSLGYVINTKVNDSIADQEVVPYKGREYIEEDMEGLRFRIGPKSFYQTNSRQAYKLYSVARKMAALTGDELVYDLYTGTGTIACFIAPKVRHVVGIEYVPEAIEDAKVNASVNGLNNTEFFAGDMKDILTSDFINAHGIPDVMIVDPPRAGMHENVVKVILDAEPRKIVYVSCNPATQARDLALLHEKYDIAEVQPVDMFPHTQHVENVVLLKLR